jgi:2-polyprenyl-3-methyl-5-hydroxy-6-metoxy-1,4-benzoquinol methylase
MMDESLRMEKFEQHTECLVSGSKKLKPIKGYEKHYLVKSSPLGFIFCSRIPTQEELIKHYEGYTRRNYISPVTIKRYHELLDEFEKYKKTGKILDVGCGIGLFLIEAQKRGWQVYGTEYTDKAIEICRSNNIEMKQGKLDPDWFDPGAFDIVTSFEVIEHINNPVEEVRNINKVLRPGGLFYFTTPNFNAVERFFLKSNYNVIGYPEHLSYYTKRTVNYLLCKNGFKKKKLTTTGISLTRIRTSLNHNCTESYVSATSTDEKLRTSLEKNRLSLFFKRSVNGLLNLSGTGSSMKGWFIKVNTAPDSAGR